MSWTNFIAKALEPATEVWQSREDVAMPVIADALGELGWELNSPEEVVEFLLLFPSFTGHDRAEVKFEGDDE
jgi:hypothetical protein